MNIAKNVPATAKKIIALTHDFFAIKMRQGPIGPFGIVLFPKNAANFKVSALG